MSLNAHTAALLYQFVTFYVLTQLLMVLYVCIATLRMIEIKAFTLPSFRWAVERSKKYRIVALFLGRREVRLIERTNHEQEMP